MAAMFGSLGQETVSSAYTSLLASTNGTPTSLENFTTMAYTNTSDLNGIDKEAVVKFGHTYKRDPFTKLFFHVVNGIILPILTVLGIIGNIFIFIVVK